MDTWPRPDNCGQRLAPYRWWRCFLRCTWVTCLDSVMLLWSYLPLACYVYLATVSRHSRRMPMRSSESRSRPTCVNGSKTSLAYNRRIAESRKHVFLTPHHERASSRTCAPSSRCPTRSRPSDSAPRKIGLRSPAPCSLLRLDLCRVQPGAARRRRESP